MMMMMMMMMTRMLNKGVLIVATMMMLAALASVDQVAAEATVRRRVKSAKNGPPPPPPKNYYFKKSPKKSSKKTSPTEAPTEAPTEEPTEAPTEAPTSAPIDAPTDSFTLSPIASTSSAVGGIAAPGSPERRLSEDILTVANFDRTLKEETDSILGVHSPTADRALEESMRIARALEYSGCIVGTSAIQFDALSDSVCAEFFTADQLVGVSFCYRFQITISAPTFGVQGCEVNTAAQLVMETLEENGSANAIGPVNDMEIVHYAPTTSPSSKPSVPQSNVPSLHPSIAASSIAPGSTIIGTINIDSNYVAIKQTQ